jgi:3-oxoacyl-[acyl-carrier-protein] synthase II
MTDHFRSDAPLHRVAVTGYGCLTSLGENVEQTWQSIMDYRVGYRRVEWADQSIKTKFVSLVEEKKERYRTIPKAILRALPLFARYALVAADEAIKTAFGDVETPSSYYAPFDCGVILGSGWAGLDQAFDVRDEYRDSGVSNPFGTLISMPSIATGACTLLWNLRGYQNTVIAACATGTIAVGDAFESIRRGRAKMMLAGGAESLRSENNVWSIDILQALSKEQLDVTKACCPFSKKRSGFVLAEGAAVLCLEEMESARRRGARILGEITGYGNCSDACDLTAPADDMRARIRAIELALAQAGKIPTAVDYINAHGTSTPLNDVNESNAIKAALGEAAYAIPISATKSYTGHLIGAAGSLETILCLKAMETRILPATIHLTEADPACDLNYLPNRHVVSDRVDTALNLSFGFGGANAALVLERTGLS